MDNERDNEIVEKYLNGQTATSLTKEYGYKSWNSIYNILKKHGVERRKPTNYMRKYQLNENAFETIDEEWKAYYLGLFYADGCLIGNRILINLGKKDKDILETLSSYLYKNGRAVNEYKSKRENEQPTCKLDICSVKMAEDIKKLGVHERKTETIELPSKGIVSKDLFHHFLRGFFDGDGCIKKHRWSICSNPEMINQLKIELENILGFNFYIQKSWTTDKIINLELYAYHDLSAFYEYIYKDATIFMKRKKDKYEGALITTKPKRKCVKRGKRLL